MKSDLALSIAAVLFFAFGAAMICVSVDNKQPLIKNRIVTVIIRQSR